MAQHALASEVLQVQPHFSKVINPSTGRLMPRVRIQVPEHEYAFSCTRHAVRLLAVTWSRDQDSSRLFVVDPTTGDSRAIGGALRFDGVPVAANPSAT